MERIQSLCLRLLAALLFCICLLPGCHRPPTPDSPPQNLRTSPTSAVSIGTSVQGRPIELVRFGAGSPVVLVIAGIHGDESSGCYVADQLIRHLRSCPPQAQKGSIAIIARANPDGYAARRRVNGHGVDLNRNFPASNWKATRSGSYYSGPAPASEPETAALLAVMESLKPVRIISIHSISGGQQCNNYDGPAADLAAAMSRLNHYPAKPTIGYATPGSLGTWAGIDGHIRTITLELPRQVPDEQVWQANREALLLAVMADDQ